MRNGFGEGEEVEGKTHRDVSLVSESTNEVRT